MNVFELRRKYSRFIYHDYKIDKQEDCLHVVFHFEIPGLTEFTPCWRFPLPKLEKSFYDEELLQSYVFNLGMIELISYWKSVCPPQIEIRCGKLSEEQQKFWKQLYISGLGEFKYLNAIEISDYELLNFTDDSLTSDKQYISDGQHRAGTELKALIPVGGGKDSIVSLERLKGLGKGRYAYSINANQAVIASMDIANIPQEQRLLPTRRLDTRLLDLNKQGYLNGHTPFSAIVAFSSVLAAFLYGINDVVLSNESSANESTVKGSDVNHQYSKSSEFEENFSNYLQKFLNPQQRYFSLLRPFSELAIAREFSRNPQYFEAFRSCNRGSKTGVWCGECAKCLFVATMLLPFLGLTKVHKIIGREIFNDPSLSAMLDELCGFEDEKPFECVGTVQEVNLALTMYINQVLEEELVSPPAFKALPFLLQRYARRAYEAVKGDVLWNETTSRITLFIASGHPLETIYEGHIVPAEYLPFLDGFLSDDRMELANGR